MKEFSVFSGYRQFYVADIELALEAPTDWTDAHNKNHHLTERNSVALVLENDIEGRICSFCPSESPVGYETPDFQIETWIEVPSRNVGILGWPWELKESYHLKNEKCRVKFSGYNTAETESNADYYTVEVIEEDA